MLLANRKEGRSVRLLREVPGEKLPENKEQAQSTTGFVGFHTGSVTLKDRPKARPKTPIPLSDRHGPPMESWWAAEAGGLGTPGQGNERGSQRSCTPPPGGYAKPRTEDKQQLSILKRTPEPVPRPQSRGSLFS